MSQHIRFGLCFVVVVMDFGSISVAISVCRDHNDDNIMKKETEVEEKRRGGNDDDLGKIVIVVVVVVVEAQLNQPQIKSRLSPRDSDGAKTRQDVTAIKQGAGFNLDNNQRRKNYKSNIKIEQVTNFK